MIIGELVCGYLHNRTQLITLCKNLPLVTEASHNEVFHLLETRSLMGKGIGVIDAHLLASIRLSAATQLWTKDRRLNALAQSFHDG